MKIIRTKEYEICHRLSLHGGVHTTEKKRILRDH